MGSTVVSRIPSGVSIANNVSPFCTPRRVSISFGSVTPTELPMAITFMLDMAFLRSNTHYNMDVAGYKMNRLRSPFAASGATRSLT